MDVTALITRTEIRKIVGLLGITPEDPHPNVSIRATTINGIQASPVSIERAAHAVAELRQEQDEDDFDPSDYPDLFRTAHTTGGAATAIEEHDPEADRRVAAEIVRMLTERFAL
ncbi:hypothetical protein GCM10010156_49650 [Planobispora rosea]|uniref:Uncharacterized protein n=1 Tax=Planobispora rosea TaxID=35762 RepID=A0A8J3WG27_PLARO|nr:hypothetical protein [Planobispora rosea]GGS85111.1 hypothetical protein GCM10010156_49650 [Planobispora rosea]GIH86476.1 hypothetical protein Pro02_48840 [Planobispora rosea]